jgi:hypothetical protein
VLGRHEAPSSWRRRSDAGRKEVEKGKWRREHEEFVSAIRAAREYTKAVQQGLPPPPPPAPVANKNDGRECCPHCARKFAPLVAERHIPRCNKNPHKVRGF